MTSRLTRAGAGAPALTFAIALVLGAPASAQQQPAPAAPQAPSAQHQESGEWAKLPKMVLERQFAGPLQDTVIQRLRDTLDGTICYLYLPISAQHSPPTATGFVQYGANVIGSISCMPGHPATPPAAGQKK